MTDLHRTDPHWTDLHQHTHLHEIDIDGDTSHAVETENRATILSLTQVSKTFNVAGKSVEALSDISLDIAEGEFLSIVGASGCGKSTLLRLILGLDRTYDGEILLDGTPVKKPGLDRGIVFQEHRLLPWLNVTANVAVALRRSKLSPRQKRDTVREHLDLVGLGSFAEAYPAQLSGGMQQRVAIARALVNRPRFLLLDEPLGALDALTRLRLQDELKRIVRHEGITAILVTHDVDEAVYLGDRIVVMQPHPGRIASILPVPLPAERNRSDAAFLRLRDHVLAELGVAAPSAKAASFTDLSKLGPVWQPRGAVA